MFIDKKNLVAVLIMFWLLAPLIIFSAGLKVFPSEIKISGEAGESLGQAIIIQNSGKTSANFLVYPDDFSKNFKITPNNFILQPQESREIFLEAFFSQGGIFNTNISVVAKSLSVDSLITGLKANAGIKIPFQAEIQSFSQAKFLGFLGAIFNQQISLGYLLIVLAIVLLFWFLFRRAVWRITKK